MLLSFLQPGPITARCQQTTTPSPSAPVFSTSGERFHRPGTAGTTAAYVYVSGSGAMFVKGNKQWNRNDALVPSHKAAAASVRNCCCTCAVQQTGNSSPGRARHSLRRRPQPHPDQRRLLTPPLHPHPHPAHCSTSSCAACQRFTAGAERCPGLYTHSCHTALWPVHLARLYNPPR